MNKELSLSVSFSFSFFDQYSCFFFIGPSQGCEFLARHLIIGNKKMADLVLYMLIQIPDAFNIIIGIGNNGNTDEAIILFFVHAFCLPGPEGTNDAATDHA